MIAVPHGGVCGCWNPTWPIERFLLRSRRSTIADWAGVSRDSVAASSSPVRSSSGGRSVGSLIRVVIRFTARSNARRANRSSRRHAARSCRARYGADRRSATPPCSERRQWLPAPPDNARDWLHDIRQGFAAAGRTDHRWKADQPPATPGRSPRSRPVISRHSGFSKHVRAVSRRRGGCLPAVDRWWYRHQLRRTRSSRHVGGAAGKARHFASQSRKWNDRVPW